jgi:hypothetical protein
MDEEKGEYTSVMLSYKEVNYQADFILHNPFTELDDRVDANMIIEVGTDGRYPEDNEILHIQIERI